VGNHLLLLLEDAGATTLRAVANRHDRIGQDSGAYIDLGASSVSLSLFVVRQGLFHYCRWHAISVMSEATRSTIGWWNFREKYTRGRPKLCLYIVHLIAWFLFLFLSISVRLRYRTVCSTFSFVYSILLSLLSLAVCFGDNESSPGNGYQRCDVPENVGGWVKGLPWGVQWDLATARGMIFPYHAPISMEVVVPIGS
jgi:hypothetical protein